MKNQEKNITLINNNHNSFSSRNSSLNKNISSELKFIVPWVISNKSNLRSCKHLIVNEKH